jgi:hypothetical protein
MLIDCRFVPLIHFNEWRFSDPGSADAFLVQLARSSICRDKENLNFAPRSSIYVVASPVALYRYIPKSNIKYMNEMKLVAPPCAKRQNSSKVNFSKIRNGSVEQPPIDVLSCLASVSMHGVSDVPA